MTKISVVVPCFNEEAGIPELVNRIAGVVGKLPSYEFEIMLINDGSKDHTWEIITEYINRNPIITGVNLSRNHGHQIALTAGLSVCSGDLIFVMDADLQDPPELLPDMLKKMQEEQADVVYGQRMHRAGESFFKLITAKMFYRLLSSLTSVDIPVDTGDFRLMTRRVLEVFLNMPEHNRFIRGMISWIGFKQVSLLYNRDARFCGETKYPLRKMIHLAVDAITAFSIKPLRIGVMLGVFGCFVGICILVYCLCSYFAGHVVSGWTSLLSAVVIMGSLQLFLIGLIGEYIGKVFIEAQNRPLFTIAEVKRSVSSSGNDNSNQTKA